MPLPSFYNTGTASVANGAATITFSGALLGTTEYPNIQAGDLFLDPAQPLVPPQRIASVDYDAGTAELWVGWPGTTMSADAYEVRFIGDTPRSTAQTRRLLEQLSVVQANGRGLFLRFDDGTPDADPGAGNIRLNNATIASATAAYVDNLDANGATISAILDSFDDQGTAAARGQLWLRSVATPSTFHAFLATGSVVDGTGYRKFTLTYIGGSGSFADGDELMVMFSAQGADGTNAILGVWQGAWQTATNYDVDDLVQQGGSTYICLEAHTSGAFSTDLAASKWDLAIEKGEQGDPGNDSTVPGPQGPGFVHEGAYSGGTAYAASDVVTYQGSSWIALGATTGNAPPSLPTTSNTWWQLFASKGADGAGTVASVVGGTGIDVDVTDPANPVVSIDATVATESYVDAAVASVDVTASLAPIESTMDFMSIILSDLYGASLGMDRGWADAFDTADGIDASASTNESYNAAGDYFEPTTTGTTQTINNQSTTGDISTNTIVDRSTALTAGDVISKIGLYNSSALSCTVKIVQRNSSGNYTVVVSESFSHPGGGWADKTLSSPYTIPGSGTFYVAVYYAAGTVSVTGSVARAYKAGDSAIGAASGFTEDTAAVLPMRVEKNAAADNMTLVSTERAAPANVGATAAFLDIDFGSALTPGTDFDFAMTSAASPSYSSTGVSYTLWYSSGNVKRYLVEGIDLTAQADDAVRARFRTLTNKAIKITGWRVRWKDAA